MGITAAIANPPMHDALPHPYPAMHRIMCDVLATPGRGRALDLGAGGGFSTYILHSLGYNQVDAVDNSNFAWRCRGIASGLHGVTFHQQGDEAFFQAHPG